MATIVSGNTIKLNNGQTVQAQEGGWYDGQQFSGGSLGAAGVINNPQQQGYGTAVDPSVIAQTNPANVAYVQKQQQQPGTASPTQNINGGTAQNVLDTYSSSADQAMSNISTEATKSDAEILAEVRSNIQPSTPQPTPPNLAQTYQSFLTSPGLGGTSVADMNTQLTSINSQIAQVQSTLEGQTTNEEVTGAGKVPLSVIAGRQTEEQRLAQVKLDSLNLQKGVLVDAINMQMTNINTLMQLTEQDYQNASTAWNQEFQNNAAIYSAFQTGVQNRNDLNFKVQQLAATNFQTMANLITSGNIQYNNLSPDAKLQITTMETQAGLPIGTMAGLQMSPQQRLLNVSNYRGQVTAIMANPNGQITTQTFGSIQGTAADIAAEDYQSNVDNATADAQSGATLQQLFNNYVVKGGLTAEEVYSIYNQYNTYGSPAKETLQEAKSGQFANL